MSRLKSALALAARGFPVFPLGAQSRKPVVSSFSARATTSPSVLSDWWARHPLHNIAVATGTPQGAGYLAVLDVDLHGRDGHAALASWEAEHGKLPETFTVATPRGGLHYYFLTPKPLRCSQSRVGEGLDIRGYHGYVVAPGSYHQELGKAYSIHTDAPVAEAPAALIEMAGVYSEKELRTAAVAPTDSPDAIARAIAYLETAADHAQEGAGGDLATFRVAARLKDLGLSQPTVFALLRDHWNANQSPPWPLAELEQKSFNVFRYGTRSVAEDSPEADFEEFDDSQPFGGAPPPKSGDLATGAFLEGIPQRRQWVLGESAMEGQVTLLIAPPGVGKSLLTIAVALSAATGRPLAGPHLAPVRQMPVWLWNTEDSQNEVRLRIAAAMARFGVTHKDLLGPDHKPMLYTRSDDSASLTVLRREHGVLVPGDVSALKRSLVASGAKLVIIDPMAEIHQANENDNAEMLTLMKTFRKLAAETKTAIFLVHHTKKPQIAASDGYAGDMNTGRGASSVAGAARTVFTLYPMSRRDAQTLGVDPKTKHLFVRLDGAKANYALQAPDSVWFRKVSVNVPTPTPEDPLGTEPVGTLEPVVFDTPTDVTDANAIALHANEFITDRVPLARLIGHLRSLPRFKDRDENFPRAVRDALHEKGRAFRIQLRQISEKRWIVERISKK